MQNSCRRCCKEKSCKTAAGDHEESKTAAVKDREEATKYHVQHGKQLPKKKEAAKWLPVTRKKAKQLRRRVARKKAANEISQRAKQLRKRLQRKKLQNGCR
jgi:hypothetical protein